MTVIDRFNGDYRFLSNFFMVKVYIHNVEYRSVEHAYQASKTLDPDERAKIQAAETASEAKRLGQKVTMRPCWDQIKVSVMEMLLIQKFSHPSLARWLLETGDQELVEGNTWGDRFWGKVKGQGQNNLGKLLMKIRKSLREGVA